MAYKNHQSAQFGIEQLILLYNPSEMQFFGFARNPYQDVCGLRRMWPKATSKIEFTVSFPYSRVTQNRKTNLYSKIELECKDISQCKFETAKASRRVKLSN